MEYITFIENNHKENEMFIFFLQYNGNEEMLTKFHEFLSSANYDMYGDYSDFQMDIKNKLSESTVNQMIKLQYGSYSQMFQKINGKFSFWILDETEMDPEKKGHILDKYLFGCKISAYFE